MTAFSVTMADLLAAVDDMSAFDRRLEQTLAGIAASMAALGTSWRGEASAQQQAAQHQWDEGAEQLRTALGQMRTIAEQAHTNYAAAAATNRRMWS